MTTPPGLPPDLNEQMRVRREKLEAWRARGVNPFGARFPVTHWAGTLQARFKDADAAALQGAGSVALAGRVVAMRHHGKTCFAVLREQLIDRIVHGTSPLSERAWAARAVCR